MAPELSTSLRTRTSLRNKPGQMQHDGLLKSLRYEQTLPARPPIPVTVAPPRAPPTDTHPALREAARKLSIVRDSTKRDSGLAPTTYSAGREGSDATADVRGASGSATGSGSGSVENATSPTMARPTTPQQASAERKMSWPNSIRMKKTNGPAKERTSMTPDSTGSKPAATPDEEYTPLTTPIPTEDQLELDFMDHITFSNRGSVMLGGKKAVNAPTKGVNGQLRIAASRRQPSVSMLATTDASKALSAELELESQKVRSMYETGAPLEWEDGAPSMAETLAASNDSNKHSEDGSMSIPVPLGEKRITSMPNLRPDVALSYRRKSDSSTRRPHELAGGIEDWEDVRGGDVDRYGFIVLREGSDDRSGTPEPRPPQRVSTALHLASEAPRRPRGFGRHHSLASSIRSGPQRQPSRKTSSRSLYTVGTSSSHPSPRKSLRSARNRLPGYQDRRWMDEAGDMLTLPPGLADIAEHEEGGRAADAVKRKEWSRTEKWRKMARVTNAANGKGMVFDFDTKNPKLIERTWKGIPDRWRSAAWFSFLKASAKKVPGSPTDEQITKEFYSLLLQSSADDVQIDMDVPRTINSHIMFRRRYRGGQRLLFRVLHSLSLYYPETRYVQGMASLAATLLCYFEEEQCFIMLVRMFSVRHLDKLYQPGFAGLMSALDDFQTRWMNGNDVSRKLDDLMIEPTAYGTRWYLTLFNYSIPFAAQLRVWDVFMLLGDSNPGEVITKERPFGGSLDILHAASAALIDGTRDILLDSDFENTMKVLTSWVPIKDEELFMKVAKAEWKLHHGKRSR